MTRLKTAARETIGITVAQGISISKKVSLRVFAWPLIFLQAKAMQKKFREFEELVFFDLWILDSGFWFPDCGLRIPVSWF